MPLLAAAPPGPVVPLHLGALHPVEQVLTLVLAFGPFLVLGVVIAVRRRQDAREEPETRPEPETEPGTRPGTQREAQREGQRER